MPGNQIRSTDPRLTPLHAPLNPKQSSQKVAATSLTVERKVIEAFSEEELGGGI